MSSNYYVRPAERDDLPSIAECIMRAFDGNELARAMGWADFYTGYRVTLLANKRRLIDPSIKQVVAIERSSGKVVGITTWEAQGDENPLRAAWVAEKERWWMPFEDKLLELEQWYSRFAVDAPYNQRTFATYEEDSKEIAKTLPERRLEMHTLAVLPEFQGLGIGKMLIAWGTAIADQHDLVAWLESTLAGFPVYQKCGYEQKDHILIARGQPGLEFAMPVMFRQPKKRTTRVEQIVVIS